MKHANFLFLISVRRAGVLFTINTLLLCLLIPFGALITGCREVIIGGSDRNLDDLLEEDLSIFALDIDKSELQIGQATRLEVKLEAYEGDEADLKYHWYVTGGEIHGTGKAIIYVAPREPKGKVTHTITCVVSSGVKTAAEYLEVTVKGPECPDTPQPDTPQPNTPQPFGASTNNEKESDESGG